MLRVRTAARALIVRNGALLTLKMARSGGVFHILPGGGQLHGEPLEKTVVRECREELGCAIEVGELAYVREYIGKNHGFSSDHLNFHQVEVVFRARLLEEPVEAKAESPDRQQIAAEWIPLEELSRVNFLPKSIIPHLKDESTPLPRLYWGDCI